VEKAAIFKACLFPQNQQSGQKLEFANVMTEFEERVASHLCSFIRF
jgi:hypothetical protein